VLAKLPAKRQNLLFSATFSKDITDLAGKLLHEPEKIQVTPPNTTVERIEQRVFRLAASHKRALLAHLITQGAWEQVLVFTRTKHGANRLAEYLDKHGLPAVAIHGNKSQNARTKALADFKANQVRILVATDIAARGLDIDQLPHVVNFELPNVEEDYVHRIGRTGRAGRSGEAISLVAPDEEKLLKSIERMTKQKIPDGDLMGFDASTIEAEKPEAREPRQPRPARNSERKPRAAKAAESSSEPKERERNRRGRNKPRNASNNQGPATPGAAAAPVSRPPRLPSDRDPEVFLDDELDNFGNRVDYVSPYQNKQNRGRRPGAPAQPGTSQPRTAAAGPRGAGAAAGAAGQGKGKRPGQSRGGQPRRKNEGRRIDNDGAPRQEVAAKPKEKQPVIIHKESKLDRLPSAEQLEQLPTKPRGEKPALLTRNR
jgi:ATP-dependent RNA helicase RhlE